MTREEKLFKGEIENTYIFVITKRFKLICNLISRGGLKKGNG